MSRLRIFRGLDFFFICFLYAYLRHAVYGVALYPRPSLRSSVVGYVANVYLRHTARCHFGC